jgi:uncharacterized protein YutD
MGTPLEIAQWKIADLIEGNTGLDYIPTDYGLGVLCSEGYFFYENAEEVLENKKIQLKEYNDKKSEYAEDLCKMYLNVLRNYLKDSESQRVKQLTLEV